MRVLFRRKLPFYLPLNSSQSLSALPIVVPETCDEWMENKCCLGVTKKSSAFNDHEKPHKGLQGGWNPTYALLTSQILWWCTEEGCLFLIHIKALNGIAIAFLPGSLYIKRSLLHRTCVSPNDYSGGNHHSNGRKMLCELCFFENF